MKEYNILILGPRAAGKTVFIPSMYYRLSKPSLETRFFLETQNHTYGRRLIGDYAMLPDGWPRATGTDEGEGGTFEYKFDCKINTANGQYNAFTITYLDYSGGKLTSRVEDENKFKNIINKSHGLLGMIDGDKLSQRLNIGGYNSTFFTLDLKNVLDELSRAYKKGKSIHMIISKWDLFKNHTLEEVKQKLLGFEEFKEFAKIVTQNGDFIRLIPVSSVGFNFAERGSDGQMLIKPDGELKPYNVEVPIALALLDPLQVAFKEKADELQNKSNANISVSPNLSWFEIIARWAGTIIQEASKIFDIKSETLNQLSEYWKKTGDEKIIYARQNEAKLKAQLNDEITNIKSQEDAIDFVVKSFFRLALQLDNEHPGSTINKV